MRPVPSPPEVPSPQVQPEVPAPQMGCAQLALRLAWYAAGPLALVVLARRIAQHGRFSGLDVAFAVILALTLAMWWLATTRFGGQRGDEEAVRRRNWRRHSAYCALVGGAAWALAHAGGR